MPHVRPAELDLERSLLDDLFLSVEQSEHPRGEHQHLPMAVELGRPAHALILEHDGRPIGYGALVVTADPGIWNLEIAVSWNRRSWWAELLKAVLREVENRRGAGARLWPGNPILAELAEAMGFREERRLHLLTCRLPLGSTPKFPPEAIVAPFRPGHDEAALLEVNNQAFAGHPEHGGWTPEVLAQRMAQPWFDPNDLMVARFGERLVGFCWVKRESADRGEIYLVAVEAKAQGRGLGRALVVNALEAISDSGGKEAFLYVDSTNEKALSLYRDLGFSLDHTDVALFKRW